ncbi:hypothetical protein VKT23_010600 [Stygiomarasmius scandens]|uniref:Uncharacterized protein n=1 Tax=Marasmiellus scandens TaxID=2682957 RepID=A0ABR1JDD6_9AGAR
MSTETPAATVVVPMPIAGTAGAPTFNGKDADEFLDAIILQGRVQGTYSIRSFLDITSKFKVAKSAGRTGQLYLAHRNSEQLVKQQTTALEDMLWESVRSPYTYEHWLVGEYEDKFVEQVLSMTSAGRFWSVDREFRIRWFYRLTRDKRAQLRVIQLHQQAEWAHRGCTTCRFAPHMHDSICLPLHQLDIRSFQFFLDDVSVSLRHSSIRPPSYIDSLVDSAPPPRFVSSPSPWSPTLDDYLAEYDMVSDS